MSALALVACSDPAPGPEAVDSDPIVTTTTAAPPPDTDPPPTDDPGAGTGTSDDPADTDPSGPDDADTSDGDGSGSGDPGGDRDPVGDRDTDGAAPVELAWGPCAELDDAALECGRLPVPLDHDDPDGATIELSLVRLPASAERQGAILLNPGGPGGSGVDYVATLATYAAGEMGLQGFDLVGFDPRGVDRSAGLRCLTDDELDEMLFPQVGPDGQVETPPGDDDPVAGELDEERFAQACRERYGETLKHYSTTATARDMDLVRAALGDDTVSYIGISYGTYLGAVYATLYPERVRAMVLDSGFEPTGDSLEERYLTQLVGFEEAFDAWAADCAADPSCPFTAETPEDVAAAWDALRERLDAEPIPGDDGRAADGSVLETATVAALYDPVTWTTLSTAVAAADGGDPGGLFDLADLLVGRDHDGSYTTIQQSNAIISCASGFAAPLPDDPEALADLLRSEAPRWADDVDADSFGDDCTDLVGPVELPDIGYDGDAPIVVIGGVNDPATPFRWSEELADRLGPSAALVTWEGEGHGQLFSSSCLMSLAADVLVELTTPPPDSACSPDPDVQRPAFWDALPEIEGTSAPLPADALVLLGLPPRLVYGEARTTTLAADELLDRYETELDAIGFSAFGREEPVPGVIVATFFSLDAEVLSLLVLTEEAYANPELGPAERLVAEGETLYALVTFPE